MGTQLPLEFDAINNIQQGHPIYTYKDRLLNLLSGDLDFHDQSNTNALHNFHSFPAKFPPQLPCKCIQELTAPQDRVLDPMTGSGTTVLEALLLGRHGIGFDIDPLALLITRVKTTPLDAAELIKTGNKIFNAAMAEVKNKRSKLIGKLSGLIPPDIRLADAQAMPLEDDSTDLIVTSPPYASNAIDYMRAHKFSLIWMGYPVHNLGEKRNEYIGGEATKNFDFEKLPDYTAKIVADLCNADLKKGQVLHRYYSEMTRVLKEMFRVLKPGKSAIVVVGSSILKGKDTETGECLADIGKSIGFEVPKIGVRNLKRDKRMMPAGNELDLDSQIQQRMHQEFVIGFYKPNRGTKPYSQSKGSAPSRRGCHRRTVAHPNCSPGPGNRRFGLCLSFCPAGTQKNH